MVNDTVLDMSIQYQQLFNFSHKLSKSAFNIIFRYEHSISTIELHLKNEHSWKKWDGNGVQGNT